MVRSWGTASAPIGSAVVDEEVQPVVREVERGFCIGVHARSLRHPHEHPLVTEQDVKRSIGAQVFNHFHLPGDRDLRPA